jgi:hypothetical protein
MPAKVTLTDEQIEIIKHNYGLMSNTQLCNIANTTPHTLTRNVLKLNIEPHVIVKDLYNFDDGSGFFDVTKYSKVAF